VELLPNPYWLPNWVLLYSLISIPTGQIMGRVLRFIEFRGRIRELEAQAI
jgi:hypothetical protein